MKKIIIIGLILMTNVATAFDGKRQELTDHTGTTAYKIELPHERNFPMDMGNGVLWKAAYQYGFTVEYVYTLEHVDINSDEWKRNAKGAKEIAKEATMMALEAGYKTNPDLKKMLDDGFKLEYTYRTKEAPEGVDPIEGNHFLFEFTIDKSDLDL